MPNSDDDSIGFEIRISVAGAVKKNLLLAMTYVPMFGVDLGDRSSLEDFADRIMAVVPGDGACDEQISTNLDALESEFGGSRLRAEMQQSNIRGPDDQGRLPVHGRSLRESIRRVDGLKGGDAGVDEDAGSGTRRPHSRKRTQARSRA